ncbi:MAG: hypothetical protein AAGD13_01795 [Pseudomonadota bacterium]
MTPLSAIYGGRDDTAQRPFVLDLTEDAVILCERTDEGELVEIQRAQLAGPEFKAQIDELRVEMLVRDPKKPPIQILLPKNQILRRDYVLASRTPSAMRAEATRRLLAETSYRADELSIDVSRPTLGEPTVVLAALQQTVSEAITYCEKWGFVPGPVSTRHHAAGFGANGPVFALSKNPVARFGIRSAQLAAASLAALVIGVGALQLYEATSPLLKALTIKPVPAQQPLSFALADQVPETERASRPVVRITSLQWIALTSAKLNDFNRVKSLSDRVPQPLESSRSPSAPFGPETRERLNVGPALSATYHERPGRPAVSKSEIASLDIRAVVNAIDRIRVGSRAQSRSAQNTSLSSRQTPRSDGPLRLAALSPSLAERAIGRTPKNSVPAGRSQEDDRLTNGDAAGAADPETLQVPLPRPGSADEPAPETTASTFTNGQGRESAQPGISEDPTSTDRDASEEAFAAVNSPIPIIRPAGVATTPVVSRSRQKSKSIAAPKLPTSVRAAAGERGLDLNETSLIGVMDARNGRRALVRLPDGEYLKVTNGDLLNGWRVSSISREAMKLTRQGRQRTLVLIAR